MKPMIFSDYGNGHSIELIISGAGDKDRRKIVLSTGDDQIRLKAECRLAELLGLVDWYRSLSSNSCPDYSFESIPLRFSYSHVEKGELYYHMLIESDSRTYRFMTWEQGKETADRMAERLLAEIKA